MSFGFFILLFALFFIIVPDYYTKVSEFLNDFLTLKPIPGLSNIQLPFPEDPHPVVYETVMRFCLVFGFFQFFILALRFYFKSSVKKMAETISNIVSWLGAAFMFNLLFIKTVEHTQTEFWFPFLGGLIAVLGFSLIARSLALLLFWRIKA
jgi:hypothetical protein